MIVDRIEANARQWVEALAAKLKPAMTAGDEPDEAKLIESATRGAECRAFLESAVVREFWATQEAQITERLLKLPLEDDAGRRNLATAAQALRQLQHYLLKSVEIGVTAERELERIQKAGKRRAFF